MKKGLEDKSVICDSCTRRYTIMFEKNEETKNTRCPYCGKANTHSRPSEAEVKKRKKQREQKKI